MVERFAEVSGVHPTAVARLRLAPSSDDDLLVTVLDKVPYQLETAGRIPVDTWK
ncbi:hypothetical protein M878_00980 [Streptomyces roseochromogenus subsp. oscitans DS 12.976]|uniref:Uncharacterized protein n=2 Tax=Streptomyces roseochromogenus TaxID=285450 RepID=V6KX30_STRRC|nr:hypothetical protein M878_00980 [Streptomyces roseochromogenus subsp. oscitans DS 12.976]